MSNRVDAPSEERSKSRLLSNRHFRTYFVGQATSLLGDGLVPLIFAFAAMQVSAAGWGMPVVLLSLWIPRMLLMGIGGSVADRYPRAMVMFCSDVVRVVAQLIPAVVFLTGTPELWHLGVSAVLYGAGTAFFVPASIGYLPEIVPDEDLQKANSWIDIITDAGMLAGPAAASGLVALGGVPLALMVDVVTFGVSLLSLVALMRMAAPMMTHAEPETESEEESEDSGRFIDAVKAMRAYPMLLALILVWCPVQFGMAAVNLMGPIVAEQEWGGVNRWAVIATVMAVGSLVGSLLGGYVRSNKSGLLTLVILTVGIPAQLAAIAIGGPIWVLAAVFLFSALAMSVAGVCFDTLVQRTVPAHMLSRVGSFEQTMTTGMVPLGLVLTLPLVEVLGRETALLALVAVTVAGGLLAFLLLWKKRELVDRAKISQEKEPTLVGTN